MFNSLTRRIVVFVFVGTALVFAGLIWYNYFAMKNMGENTLRENAKNETLRYAAEINSVFTAAEEIPENLAVVLENFDFNDEELNLLLSTQLQQNPEVYGMIIAYEPYRRQKKEKFYAPYVHYSNNGEIKLLMAGSEKHDYFEEEWYKAPATNLRPHWSEPYYDEGIGEQLMITYSVPFYKYGKNREEPILQGVSTVDIDIDWLERKMMHINARKSGYGAIITGSGRVVAHPVDSLVMHKTVFDALKIQYNASMDSVFRRMLRGESGVEAVHYKTMKDGKDSWVAYAPLRNGWSIVFFYPVEDYLSELVRVTHRLILIGVVFLLLLLGVIYLISRSITKPIVKLTRVSDKVAAGDYAVDFPEPYHNDEIARLSRSFESMLTALKKMLSELEDINHNLEDKVALRTREISTIGEMGRGITAGLNFEHVIVKLYNQTKELMPCDAFTILSYNKERSVLEGKFAVEEGVELPYYEYALDEQRFATWCVKNRQPILINDNETEHVKYIPQRVVPKGKYVQSLIYLPLISQDEVVGAISIQSYTKDAYTAHDLEIFNMLAAYTAVAVANAQSFEAIRKINKDLQDAQNKLIQSEKMASLGQLTAGIAHEIKNPLNFVNNFSELSIGLVDEIEEDLEKAGNVLPSDIKEDLEDILSDLKLNVSKINEHGKRADSIVKGMLLYSRGKSGEMQLTDINALLAEYVNLGYHGMRSQDKTFNIKMEQQHDPALPKINVVPQDLSRVFLNIINNACYATHEKHKVKGDSYFPLLSTTTINHPDTVEIRIRDNGTGISEENMNRLFNPFFTTKPTGKGTGLGLSMTYEIVTTQHKGEIRVDSKEGEYTEFIIIIPKNLK